MEFVILVKLTIKIVKNMFITDVKNVHLVIILTKKDYVSKYLIYAKLGVTKMEIVLVVLIHILWLMVAVFILRHLHLMTIFQMIQIVLMSTIKDIAIDV